MSTQAGPAPAFQLVAGHPALDLINTLDWRFRLSGEEELLRSYEDLLRFLRQSRLLKVQQAAALSHATSPRQGEAILARCIAIREAAARVFYSMLEPRSPDTLALTTLESRFKEAYAHRNLTWMDVRVRWEFGREAANPELPVWVTAHTIEDLLLSDRVGWVHACENIECRWLFLDTSKNHTRRWCDMKLCGNRMKARRFKAQHKGSAETDT